MNEKKRLSGAKNPACAITNTDFSKNACVACGLSAGCAHAALVQENDLVATLGKIKYKIFVMSGKGGVGKSSVAVNVAAALAAGGHKVGLLDLDLHGPSVANLLGRTAGKLNADPVSKKIIPLEFITGLCFISVDSMLPDPDRAVIWRGPKKAAAIRSFIAEVQWGDLDFLIIDSPPGTGDEHMTVLKIIPDILSVVVTTPQEIALSDVRKSLNFLGKTQGKILGIVENMSGLACPQCGADIPLFKKGGGEALAAQKGLAFLGSIAIDPLTVLCADLGRPIVFMDGDSVAKRDFYALADTILKNCLENRAALLKVSRD
ncbi:MAG: Mrp/NBP35 family ATP-binding protein [Desulfovibrio sp.]|nr:Mrp/NBP35 family ATP-binding protein [Desulfovibrio sp.]